MKDEQIEQFERDHPLATKRGLFTFLGILAYQGSICPQCGYGTRAKSKKWRECKKCGTKVERRELPKPPRSDAIREG